MFIKKLLVGTIFTFMTIAQLVAVDGTLNLLFSRIQNFIPRAIAIQADGKIVVTGTTESGMIQTVRYMSTGMLDTSFGTHGLVTGVEGTPYTIFIQPEGQIVIGGQLLDGHSFVYRYLSDGASDISFGFYGSIIGGSGTVYALDMQADGMLIVGGVKSTNTGSITRYTTLGVLDTQFQTMPNMPIRSIAVQSDGTIIAGGTDNSNITFLLRYLTNGGLDRSFGVNGIAHGPTGTLTGIALQPDGKILAGGTNIDDDNNFQITRFLNDGSLDTAFGSGGSTTGPEGTGNGLLLQTDGKPILIGQTSNDLFQIARYTSAGLLDTSFNGTGFATGPFTAAYNGALPVNGNILAAEFNNSPVYAQIAQYTGTETIITPTITQPIHDSIMHQSTIDFSGAAQNGSRVFLLVDDVFVDGTSADDTNQWLLSALVPASGEHKACVVSEYRNGNLLIKSPTIPFTVGGIATLFADIRNSTQGNPVTQGDFVTYVITITNRSASDAINLTIVDSIPNGITYIFWACINW